MKAAVFHKPENINDIKVLEMFDDHTRSCSGIEWHRSFDFACTRRKGVLDDIITHTLTISEVSHGYKLFDKKRRLDGSS